MQTHTYLFTGAGRKGRLGYQIALRFLEEGDNLLLAIHKQMPQIPSRYQAQVRFVSCDFSRPSSLESLLDGCGAIDGIINAASEFSPCSWEETDEEALCRSLMVHAVSPFLLTKLYAKKVHCGSVVHLLDSYALFGHGMRASYRLAKSALHEQVRILAPLVAPGVRVNAVSPGMVVPAAGEEEIAKREVNSSPLKRLATVEDVFRAIRFLLETPSVTGQTIFVDCGAHLR